MLNILCALFLCLHLSLAQDFISAMTSVEGHTLIEAENVFSPSQKIDHGPHETAVHQRNFSVQHPVFKNEKTEGMSPSVSLTYLISFSFSSL